MNLIKIRNSFIAGLCGTAVHSILLLVHSKSGPLPEFQPNEDIRRGLAELIGTEIHPGIAWLVLFVNGAMIWGFVFGQTYQFLPGQGPLQKGVFCGRIRLRSCARNPNAGQFAHLRPNDEFRLSFSKPIFSLTKSVVSQRIRNRYY